MQKITSSANIAKVGRLQPHSCNPRVNLDYRVLSKANFTVSQHLIANISNFSSVPQI